MGVRAEAAPGGPQAWVEIDEAAVEHNVAAIVRFARPAGVMAVLKADACGHGALRLAPLVLAQGACGIGVARLDEALALRRACIARPVYVLGHIHASASAEIVEGDFVVNASCPALAEALSREAVERERLARVHVEVDAGLRRWGVRPAELPTLLDRLSALPGVEVEGIFTHFANLDSGDFDDTERAFCEFLRSAALAERTLSRRLVRHVCNTAGTFALPRMHLDMVRPGVGLYGIWPLEGMPPPIELVPAMSVKSRVAAVRRLAAGEPVGYGSTYRAREDTTIALVPLGFGDGLPPGLGGRGEALVRGRRAALVGVVSTDAVALDVGGVPGVRPGDEVVFIGGQGRERIRVEELADALGTFADPILINLGRGLPRRYVRGGRP